MKRLIAVGILVFLIVLVVRFPAELAYRWFAPPQLQLSGISGSIWEGNAAEGLAVDAYLTDINWRLRAGDLFKGRLTFATSVKPAGGEFATDVSVSPGGAITLANLTGGLPLGLVHPVFQQEGISGDLDANFSRVVLENGLPTEVAGQLTISGLYAPVLSAAPLGDYRLDLTSVDGVISGALDDLARVDAVLDKDLGDREHQCAENGWISQGAVDHGYCSLVSRKVISCS